MRVEGVVGQRELLWGSGDVLHQKIVKHLDIRLHFQQVGIAAPLNSPHPFPDPSLSIPTLCSSRRNPYPPHGRSLKIPRGSWGRKS